MFVSLWANLLETQREANRRRIVKMVLLAELQVSRYLRSNECHLPNNHDNSPITMPIQQQPDRKSPGRRLQHEDYLRRCFRLLMHPLNQKSLMLRCYLTNA